MTLAEERAWADLGRGGGEAERGVAIEESANGFYSREQRKKGTGDCRKSRWKRVWAAGTGADRWKHGGVQVPLSNMLTTALIYYRRIPLALFK